MKILERIKEQCRTLKNENGAIDLASIMVGVIVLGLIGGVVSATVFTVIPWSQDNAAKQQLDSIASAQSAYKGLSSGVPPEVSSGNPVNSYADSSVLETENLLTAGNNYCTVLEAEGQGYQAFTKSSTGKLWKITDDNTQPRQAGTWELQAGCEHLLQGSRITSIPYLDPNSNLTSLTYKCDTDGVIQPPIRNATGSATWSDSSITEHNGAALLPTKTVEADKEYVFKFVGTYDAMSSLDLPGVECLRSVNHWGSETGVTSIAYAFHYATNLTDVPPHLPATVKDTSRLFYHAHSFNDMDVIHWDVSNVENMDRMFYWTLSFNQPLNHWDVSSVKEMGHMFFHATKFNQPLNDWDVSNVERMDKMFKEATVFNQPLDKWNVSKVTNVQEMFISAPAFLQDLSSWKLGEPLNGREFVPVSYPDEFMPAKTLKN